MMGLLLRVDHAVRSHLFYSHGFRTHVVTPLFFHRHRKEFVVFLQAMGIDI